MSENTITQQVINFGHLHVHTEHSKLDGMPRIQELLARAKELGQTFMAVTDHGTCSGLYELDEFAEQFGIKPIFGCEFYLDIGQEKLNHLVLLAKNEKGLENIFALHEWSYVKGFSRKPTINMNVLQQYSEGIVCSSACLANVIPKSLSMYSYAIAHEWACKFLDIFGEDFYLEVQSNTIMEQKIANEGIIRLANDLGVKYIATNDVHYELKEDAEIHDVMLALQTNRKMNDPKRWSFTTKDFWFKDVNEMYKDLHGLTSEQKFTALKNTQEIASKCNVRLKRGTFLPKFYDVPEGQTEEQILRKIVTERYKKEIVARGLHTPEYKKEVAEELKVIEETGYAGYHLIVQDFVNYARTHDINVGDGRGSGAGCKTAYILGITRIEPNKYNLLFERFLSLGREPDYDIDFADNNAIFSYLQRKYGIENVARIVAFGTLAPRAVVRKVFSAFGYNESIIAQVTGCIPQEPKITLEKAYKSSKKLVEFKKKYEKEFKIIERLEGRISHESQHAGGVVIYPGLNKLVPLHTTSEDRTKRIISWDKYAVEKIGLCKIDCLGLVALETIDTCIKYVKDFKHEKIDIYEIDYEDKNVYKDLCAGKVSGVFQVENQSGMIIEQQPSCFLDLIALNALIRPGVGDFKEYLARKRGKAYYLNPLREAYMRETCGLYVYQEQFELDCKTFAGWTIAYADKHVRKNKHIEDDVELKEKFLTDAVKNGHDYKEMSELWQEIVNAVKDGYTFNKSHATAYAVILFRTAWLKHYYPQYWYASLMNKYFDDSDKLSNLVAECKQEGIKLLPPDINKSINAFTPTNEGILYAISSIKTLGQSAYEHLIELRPFKDLQDLLERSTRKLLRENVIANLIYAGCFDKWNEDRYEMLMQLKTYFKSKKEYEKLSNMEYEYIALGVYLRKHPLEQYSFKQLQEFPDGANALIAGIVIDVAEVLDKRGNKMAFITLNNQYGNVKCLAFSSFWTDKKTKHEDFDDKNIIMLRGKRSGNDLLINSYEILR